MKTWVPLVLSAVFAGSTTLMSVASVAHAQPPGARPAPPAMRPAPPGAPMAPGMRPAPPGAPLPPGEIANRFNQLQAQRLAERDNLRRNQAQWEAQRNQRLSQHQVQLAGVWGADFLARPECHAELALDAERQAQLDRIIDIAHDTHNAAMLARANAILARENARHVRVMTDLRIKLGFR
jgi:hypothetical protein